MTNSLRTNGPGGALPSATLYPRLKVRIDRIPVQA